MTDISIMPLNDTFTLGGVKQKAAPPPDPYARYCKCGKTLALGVDRYVLVLIEGNLWDDDLRRWIRLAKNRLHDLYYNLRQSAPPKHSTYTGNGHICLFHVYIATCERIREIELEHCLFDADMEPVSKQQGQKATVRDKGDFGVDELDEFMKGLDDVELAQEAE